MYCLLYFLHSDTFKDISLHLSNEKTTVKPNYKRKKALSIFEASIYTYFLSYLMSIFIYICAYQTKSQRGPFQKCTHCKKEKKTSFPPLKSAIQIFRTFLD